MNWSSSFLESRMLWCQRNLGSRLLELLLYFPSPREKVVLIATKPGPVKEMSNSKSSSVSLYHSRPPDMDVTGACVLQASGKEGWQNWGEVGRKGKETSVHSFL